MWVLTIRFIIWLWQKLAPLLLAALLMLAGTGLYFYVTDSLEMEGDRTRRLEAIETSLEGLTALRDEAVERREALRAEAEKARTRYRQAERLIANLEALRGFWDNLFRSREEKEREAERLIWARQKKEEFAWSLEDLTEQLAATQKIVENLDERAEELQRERALLEEAESEVLTYAERAWAAVRQPMLIGAAVFLGGPTVWKLFCFYGWASLIGLARPLQLRVDEAPEVRAEGSQVSKQVWVKPGERAILKEKFLQASDEDLARRTRFVFDWRIPFSSAACGLIELTQMTNTGERDLAITFSTQEEAMTELTVIELPADGRLVLRPSHLAGVVARADERLRIERHWRIFSVHAWVTFQFRYFEFHGPCRLIVCGRRGVRAEPMAPRAGAQSAARRTNRNAMIGFTPNLAYRSVRAETFWAYYRGRNPLFDDLFRGAGGAFFCQEISTRDDGGLIRRFWSNFRGAVMNVFGL